MRCTSQTEAHGCGLTPLFTLLSHCVSLSLCLCMVLHLSSLPLPSFAFLPCQTLTLLVDIAHLSKLCFHHPSYLGFLPLFHADFSYLPHLSASCLMCLCFLSWLRLPLSCGLPHSHALLLSALLSLSWFCPLQACFFLFHTSA